MSLSVLVAQESSVITDWPAWRGAKGDGISADTNIPPALWDETLNVTWKRPIPGKGHGSPIVVGQQVMVATADVDAQVQWLVALDRATGQELWKCAVHEGGLKVEGNKKASLASSTPCCDGERIYINFLNQGAAWTSAVSLDGKLIWQQKISDYTVHQGYGSSPRVYRELVIVSADNKGGGALVALNRKSGEMKWRIERPKLPNYASPVVVRADGKDQLIFTGCDLVADAGIALCWNSKTGEEMWKERLGGTFSGSPVMIGDRIYATNEEGTTFVFQVSPENFQLLGANTLGDESYSTPAIAGGSVFLRYASYDGDHRQEYLACVSE